MRLILGKSSVLVEVVGFKISACLTDRPKYFLLKVQGTARCLFNGVPPMGSATHRFAFRRIARPFSVLPRALGCL